MSNTSTRAVILTTAATLGLALSSGAYAYGEKDAISDCEGRMRSEYHLSDLRDAEATRLNDSELHFQVKGVTKIDNHRHPWTCEVKNRHVTSVNYQGPKAEEVSGAAKLAIGAAALAAVGALAAQAGGGSSQKDNSRDTDTSERPSPTQYDATANLKCSMNKPTHNKKCQAAVTRGRHGSATVEVTNPAGVERVLHFKGGDITTSRGELDWDKQGGNWYIGIDDREFYIVPETFVLGR